MKATGSVVAHTGSLRHMALTGDQLCCLVWHCAVQGLEVPLRMAPGSRGCVGGEGRHN